MPFSAYCTREWCGSATTTWCIERRRGRRGISTTLEGGVLGWVWEFRGEIGGCGDGRGELRFSRNLSTGGGSGVAFGVYGVFRVRCGGCSAGGSSR